MTVSENHAPGDAGRPRLSRQVIADAALQLIDEQGVATASLRGVAAQLGYESMSLYRYVANRDGVRATPTAVKIEVFCPATLTREPKRHRPSWPAVLDRAGRAVSSR